jgi:hypothetical protein
MGLLREGGLRRQKSRGAGDPAGDPMEGAANLADVMLVLAVGFLLALIMSWNTDWMLRESGISEIGEMSRAETDALDAGRAYEPMGQVYRDPASGTLYLVTETPAD